MPAMPLPEPLSRRPFSAADARQAGLSRRRLQGPAVRQLFRGAYVAAGLELTLAVRVQAALTILPANTVAVSVTALQLDGVEVGPSHPLRFCTTHPGQVRRAGLAVIRVGTLPPFRGDRVSPEHAFASAAQHLNLLDLVTAGDWLLRLRRCSLASLLSYVAGHKGRGAVLARRASGMVRAKVDSPRETRLRLILVLAGLPTPDCNPRLGNDHGPIGWVDLAYQVFKVIVEYEGDQHRTDARQWNTDIDRFEAFTAEGFRIVRITSHRIRRPRDVVRRVYDALRLGGYAGPEPVFTAEWCALFEP